MNPSQFFSTLHNLQISVDVVIGALMITMGVLFLIYVLQFPTTKD